MRQTWVLELHSAGQRWPATPGAQQNSLTHVIPEKEVDAVRARLLAAMPGDFVEVPVEFVNQVTPSTLVVQPHLWGAWTIHQTIID